MVSAVHHDHKPEHRSIAFPLKLRWCWRSYAPDCSHSQGVTDVLAQPSLTPSPHDSYRSSMRRRWSSLCVSRFNRGWASPLWAPYFRRRLGPGSWVIHPCVTPPISLYNGPETVLPDSLDSHQDILPRNRTIEPFIRSS